VAESDQRIVLTLCGSKAERGVELDGLEVFIEHFRRALREFERTLSAREQEVGRTGQPGSRSKWATGFRLVHFEIGSSVAQLEPMELSEADDQLLPTEPVSSENLRSLLEAVEMERALSPRVIESLDGARKALGRDGRFGVRFSSQKKPFFVGAAQIQRLDAAATQETEPKEVTVSGKLHLIETEQPERVEIRAGDGVNWACTYDDDLEERVSALVRSLVRAQGIGKRTAYNRGSMHLREIEPLPKFEQTPLFTRETIPTRQLERQQGITRPQGLAALQDPEWVDDKASREYLAILDES
jgi:hypothetical protein